VVWTIAAVSAVAAALSPAAPTGLRAADALWCGLIGGIVALAASRSRRWALAWLGGIAAVVGIGGDAVAVAFAVASIAVTLAVAASRRRDRLVGALLGAVAIQALLRGPNYGFVGLPTIVGLVAVLPVLVTGYRMARRRERRAARYLVAGAAVVVVLGSAAAAVAAIASRSSLEDGRTGATAGLDSLRAGDTAGASTAFGVAASDFEDANGTLEGPLTWVGRALPVVGQHVEALRRVSAAGQDLGTSAAETASTTDYRSLTATGGQVDLQKIAALQGPVARSAATVEDALAAVDAVESPWLVPLVTDELDRFRAELSDVGEQTRLAADGLRVAPALLGADGAKRYFLTLATPGESRNAGGYAGAFGVLRTDQGRLELELTGKSADLNRPASDPYQLVYPPDWEQRYQRYHVDLFTGNLTASPDWPTDADLIGQVYREATGADVAGAVYADPEALAALLRLTGPVDVAGLDAPITADNVEQFLLTDQYVRFQGDNATRRDMLGDVAEAVFHALTSKPLPGISTIADTLGPAVEAGHLRITVYDPDSEAFLDDVGITGRFTTSPGADHLALVSANQLPNKIDLFLHRSWNVAVTHDAATGEVRSTVTVTLRNDAPASGLPPYILGDGKVLPRGTNLDLLGLYSPLTLTTVSLDGEPGGSENQTESGSNVYSVSVRLAPGQTRTVTFELAGTVDPGPYRLDVLPQPLATTDDVTVVLNGDHQLFAGPLMSRLELGGASQG